MDMKTLKALVVECRNSGMTYREISEKLAEEYGIIRSRQSLQGLYKRAIKNIDEEEKDKNIPIADIVNLHCLGYNRKEITDIINKMGYKLNYHDVVLTIKEQDEYIKEVEESIVDRVVNLLNDGYDRFSISYSIQYKNKNIEDKKLDDYLTRAYYKIILQNIKNDLKNVYEITDNKGIVKSLISMLNLDIKISDLK